MFLLYAAYALLGAGGSVADELPANAGAAPVSFSCPAGGINGEQRPALLHAVTWSYTVQEDWPAGSNPVVALQYPFYGELALRLPGETNWHWRSPLAEDRDPGWRGDLAVLRAENGLAAGDVIQICARFNLVRPRQVEILSESRLHARELSRTRIASLSEGSLLAMTLAGATMAVALRNGIFMAIAGVLAFALLYLVSNNGSFLDLPLGARLVRDWPLQRIGGLGAHLLLLLALSQFLDLPKRYPGLWRVMVVVTGLLLFLLLFSLLPMPYLRFAPLGLLGNFLLALSACLMLGRTIIDARRGHEPSRALLWSWAPVMVVVIWMAVQVLLTNRSPITAGLLFPPALIYACGFLFLGLARRMSEVQAQRDQARLRAEMDGLTGALSRPALDSLLDSLRCGGSGSDVKSQCAILFVDFDHFKRINDAYGHHVGDRALTIGVARIAANLRDVDHVGRYGGEEFLVVLQGLSAPAALEVAERIRIDIENRGLPLTSEVPALTVSIGVAVCVPDSDCAMSELITDADRALYAAKGAGRNCVRSAAQLGA